MRIGTLLLALVAAAAASDPDEKVLWSHGVSPDPDGVRRFLRSLAPTEAVLAQARSAAATLASPHPVRRQHATDRLKELGASAIPALAAAAESEDPEVARGARELLASACAMRETVATAAFHVIAAQRMKGLAAEVLASRKALRERHSRLAAEEALVATVTPEEAGDLRRLVGAGGPDEQPIAVAGYAAAAGPASRPELRAWTEDSQREPIRLAAAWALADLGDAACLPVFAQLLDAEDCEVRLGAANALRQISGERFGYVALADPAERTAAVISWGDWVSGHADTARWETPVPRVPRFLGRILVTQYNERCVTEFDLAGRKLWEEKVNSPWACGGTPRGHRLVGQAAERRVVEYDAAGRQIRAFEGLRGFPSAVHRLPNGNTLVAVAFRASFLVEFDRDGRRVWECDVEGFPADAERLPNGRTLVALYQANKVAEIDASGKIVWEIPRVDFPYSVQRLDNGNTLVCETRAKRAVEYTRAGRVVWQHALSTGCMGARRLPDGRTLISTNGGIVVVQRDGSETWLMRGKGAVRASFH